MHASSFQCVVWFLRKNIILARAQVCNQHLYGTYRHIATCVIHLYGAQVDIIDINPITVCRTLVHSYTGGEEGGARVSTCSNIMTAAQIQDIRRCVHVTGRHSPHTSGSTHTHIQYGWYYRVMFIIARPDIVPGVNSSIGCCVYQQWIAFPFGFFVTVYLSVKLFAGNGVSVV